MGGANAEIRKLYAILREVHARLKVLEDTEHPASAQATPAPVAQGDMIVADATPQWGILTRGGAHFLCKMNAAGTTPVYEAYDWDLVAAASGADMVHGHTSDAEGGLLPLFPGKTQWDGASAGDAYNQASIEIIQTYGASLDAPHLSFHYAGAVASQIGFFKGDNSGDICILNNPGTGYEKLRAVAFRVYNGTTLVGELSATDTTWFRLNQNVAKNIYTPRRLVVAGGLESGDATLAPGAGQIFAYNDIRTIAAYFVSSKAKYGKWENVVASTAATPGTRIIWGTQHANVGTYVRSDSNRRIAVPETGTYTCHVQVLVNHGAYPGARCDFQIRVNGVARERYVCDGYDYVSHTFMATEQLTAGQYFDVYVMYRSAVGPTFIGGADYYTVIWIVKDN